jgi:hypothetical protein
MFVRLNRPLGGSVTRPQARVNTVRTTAATVSKHCPDLIDAAARRLDRCTGIEAFTAN